MVKRWDLSQAKFEAWLCCGFVTWDKSFSLSKA